MGGFYRAAQAEKGEEEKEERGKLGLKAGQFEDSAKFEQKFLEYVSRN